MTGVATTTDTPTRTERTKEFDITKREDVKRDERAGAYAHRRAVADSRAGQTIGVA
jgi:hypothetical protein